MNALFKFIQLIKRFAPFLLILGLAPAFAQEDAQLRIEWRIGDKIEHRIVKIQQNVQPLSIDATQKQTIVPTSGDCSRWDTSQLQKEWTTGMRMNGMAYQPKTDEVTVHFAYEFMEFLGMKKHEFTPGCFIGNGSASKVTGDTTLTVKKGKPVEFREPAYPDTTREYVMKFEVL